MVPTESQAWMTSFGSGSGQAKEQKDGAIEADHVFIRKTPDTLLQLALRNGRDLVDHQLTPTT
jgi:hypothetical protein